MHNIQQIKSTYQIKVSICHDYKLNQYISLGKTEEIVLLNNEGAFSSKFIFDYHFEREQLLRLELIKDYNLLEMILVPIGRIMGSQGLLLAVPMQRMQGTIRIQGNRNSNSNNSAYSSTSLFKVLFNMPSPSNQPTSIFYVINQRVNQSNWRMLYKSNEILVRPNILEMLNQFDISTQAFCSNNMNQEYKIDIYFVLNFILVGIGHFNMSDLRNNSKNNQSSVIQIQNLNGKNAGFIQIQYSEEPVMTFIDYLKYGMEINLVIAIDYSASNQDPNYPNSNHYVHGNGYNNYEQAISSCGKILAYYDHDQQFPVFGFGATPPGQNAIQHCFPINFQNNPCIFSIDNVISTYRSALMNITLQEPTCFSPVIKTIMDRITSVQVPGDNKYYILLLLTDGLINDIQETCNLIVEASYSPLSIIIIGIGNANFQQMVTLDGDDFILTSSKGVQRKRDLVQFVRFNDYKDNFDALAQNVCEEIPHQVEKYFSLTKTFAKKGIASNLL